MPLPKKWLTLLSCLIIGIIFWVAAPLITIAPDHSFPVATRRSGGQNFHRQKILKAPEEDDDRVWRPTLTPEYKPGTVKPIGEPYTKSVIVPKTKGDDVEWIAENFGDAPNFRSFIYSVDDSRADLHTPRNKGHEVMVYLSFIIDNYSDLSDVNIFLHSHQFSWHNNDLLDNDIVQMITRLSSERVQRVGYMNMRCHWGPGCPSVRSFLL